MDNMFGQNNRIVVPEGSWGVVSFDSEGKPYIAKPGNFCYLDFNTFVDADYKFQNAKLKTVIELHLPKQLRTYVPTEELPQFVEIVCPETEPVVQASPSLTICIEEEKGDKVYYEYTFKKDENSRPIYRRSDRKPKGLDEQRRNMDNPLTAKQKYIKGLSKI